MPEPEPGLDQMFPSLSPGEIDRLRRFGTIQRYAAAEPVVTVGDVRSGMFVVISGAVTVTLQSTSPVAGSRACRVPRLSVSLKAVLIVRAIIAR